MVARQATLLAYMDVFWVAALFSALIISLVLLLLHRVDTGAAPAVQ